MHYALPANGIGSNELADSVPVVIAGILAVYGLVVSIMIANTLRPETPFHGICSSLGQDSRRPCQPWSWVCNWYHWGCWSEGVKPTAQAICGYDVDSDLL